MTKKRKTIIETPKTEPKGAEKELVYDNEHNRVTGEAWRGEDDADYRSDSTIDNPPKDDWRAPAEDQDGQVEIPGAEAPKKERQGREVKFKLQLKADDYVIPVSTGKCPADMVEESLGKGLNSTRFRMVLREVVGQPLNASLCDKQIATDREDGLSTAVKNYANALSSLLSLFPENPEASDHALVCRLVREARAKIKQAEETAERQLQATDQASIDNF